MVCLCSTHIHKHPKIGVLKKVMNILHLSCRRQMPKDFDSQHWANQTEISSQSDFLNLFLVNFITTSQKYNFSYHIKYSTDLYCNSKQDDRPKFPIHNTQLLKECWDCLKFLIFLENNKNRPSSEKITTGFPSSITETHEYVVPKSMPMYTI